MFLNKIKNNYECDYIDSSVHSGIPKQYYHLKNKHFNDWEIAPWELFIFSNKLLGEGSFSKVYLAKWRETFVVAKVIKPEILEEKKFLLLREIDIMSKLHHPNIVQFLGYIDNPFIIVMEYIPNKNLQENNSLLYKSSKISIMKDILKGLAYIHNRRPYSLIHRDIKPTNIILTNSKVAKITDFGLSKFYSLTKTFSNNDLSKINNNINELYENDLTCDVGTFRFMAPEMKKQIIYNNKIDIYSCGVLLYEMFENKKFIDKSQIYWYRTPKIIRNIILNYMLEDDPNNRYDAIALLKILNRNKL
tara:strand:- start:372 stop:1283 length:912 start_codon:yes stop_codon:yes gene_type:complete